MAGILMKEYIGACILCTAVMFSVVSSGKISKSTIEHIDFWLDEFLKQPTRCLFDGIIRPPRNVLTDNESFEQNVLPKLIIWCPVTRYSLTVKCPVHDASLKPSFWTNSIKCWRQPRLLYDIGGNIFLVSRVYICSASRCRYQSCEAVILKQLPSWIHVPFQIYHRSGISDELLDYVYTHIGCGITFNKISKAIELQNAAEYYKILKSFILKTNQQQSSYPGDCTEYPKHCERIFASPSRDFLIHCFLQDFDNLKDMFTAEMQSLHATHISVDHTFKICKNVGVKDSINKWTKQYPNAFIILNEIGQIVSWALTRTTAFAEVQPLFSNLRDRICGQGQSIQNIYIDNCCLWRQKLNTVFGPGLSIKLDLFHAVKRFTSTIPKLKTDPKRFEVIQDFSLVFRYSGDQCRKRKMSTPDAQSILTNLENFEKKWDVLSCYGEESHKAIKNIKKHILAGCLSNIPVGHGTERNENLHSILNSSVLSQAKTIGPELLLAVISVLFFTFNNKMIGKTLLGRNYLILKKCFNDYIVSNESFGIIPRALVQPSEDETLLNSRTFLTIEETSEIISNMVGLNAVLHNFVTQCKTRSLDIFGLPNSFNKHMLCFLGGRLSTTGNYDGKDDLLARRLSSFSLERVQIAGDGNCAFMSIVQQLQLVTTYSDQTDYSSFLLELGITGTAEEQAKWLRHLFVNELTKNAEEYRQNYTHDLDKDLFLDEVAKFSNDGVFTGQLGDLVMLVLSRVLHCAIIVVSSMEAMEVVPLFPNKIISKHAIFVAYDNNGPGHYDGTMPSLGIQGRTEDENESSRITQPQTVKSTSCRCGQGSVKKNPEFIACCDNVSSGYKTRCPCLKRKVGCTSCSCKNCGNTFNTSEETCFDHARKNCTSCNNVVHEKKSRKRRKLESNYVKTDGLTYLRQITDVNESGWTSMETCLLETVLEFLNEKKSEISALSVLQVFNEIVNSSDILSLRIKSEKQIQSKMKYRSNCHENFLSHLSTQLKIEHRNTS